MSLFHLEKSDLHEIFLSKIHSIITGNIVLDAAAANIDIFLLKVTCVSSIQLNRPTSSKRSLCIL
jgi:hypothetical protein